MIILERPRKDISIVSIERLKQANQVFQYEMLVINSYGLYSPSDEKFILDGYEDIEYPPLLDDVFDKNYLSAYRKIMLSNQAKSLILSNRNLQYIPPELGLLTKLTKLLFEIPAKFYQQPLKPKISCS